MKGMKKLRFIDEKEPVPSINKKLFLRIIRYFSPYKLQLTVCAAAILLSALLGLVPPMLLKNIVDTALPNLDMKLLTWLILLSVSATALHNLIRVGQSYLNTWISKQIIYTMKNQMYRHLEHMPMEFFATAKPGDITTRMNSDIDGIQDIFNATAVNALSSVFILATTAGALFSMNWKLGLVSIATIPLFILPTRKVGKIRWKIAAATQEKLDRLNQIVHETLSSSGSTLMKLFTAENREFEEFRRINRETVDSQLRESLAGRWFGMTMNVFTFIGPMLIYFFGGLLMIRGELTVGGIIAFASLLTRLYHPVIQLSNIHIDFVRSFALFSRIFDYLDIPHTIADVPGGEDLEVTKGEIRFENVNFSYRDGSPALSGISFTAAPGSTVALVGPSGAGKTTLTNLIPRLCDVRDGTVLIDGQDIRSVNLSSLRSQIGMVMQEPYLFNGTIRENILYGKEDASQEEVIEACRAAYIHDFILSQPEGYDTVVGNRGLKLSGGEKQRISIARVLLKNPKIIILDEATSALDSLSEDAIQKALIPLLENRTSLVIAHRLSTVVNADQILVMENGKIQDRGTHGQLLRKEGLYRQLYMTQFEKGDARVA